MFDNTDDEIHLLEDDVVHSNDKIIVTNFDNKSDVRYFVNSKVVKIINLFEIEQKAELEVRKVFNDYANDVLLHYIYQLIPSTAITNLLVYNI